MAKTKVKVKIAGGPAVLKGLANAFPGKANQAMKEAAGG